MKSVQGISVAGILICSVLWFAGCGEGVFESRPNALGKTNEIVVVMDEPLWNGRAGDSLIWFFEAPFPIMPQPEPMFDIRHFTPEDLSASSLRKELRTYLFIADLDDQTSPTTRMIRNDLGEEKIRRATEDPGFFTSVGQDKWARGQILMYVFGFGQEDLIDKMIRAFPAIAKRVQDHDRVQIDAATYLHREAVTIGQLIRDKFGVSIKIPGDFKVAIESENFLWIRQDTRDMIGGIALRRFPYSSESQLEHDGFVDMRDRMGLLIEGSSVGSFMRTNDTDLPVYLYQKEIGGRYAVEGRGIWELTADFMGGPFVSYAIIDEGEILFIDTFVHAPGKTKRDYVQRMEHVISSLRF